MPNMSARHEDITAPHQLVSTSLKSQCRSTETFNTYVRRTLMGRAKRMVCGVWRISVTASRAVISLLCRLWTRVRVGGEGEKSN